MNNINEIDTVINMTKSYGLSSGDLHRLMKERAEVNPKKGKKGGDCNRTQCQAPGASSWNKGSRSWYCNSCGTMLERENRIYWNQDCPGQGPMVDVLPDFHYPYSEHDTSDTQEHNKKQKYIVNKINHLYKKNPAQVIREFPKTKRNDPCLCGSGLKYKKCCGNIQ